MCYGGKSASKSIFILYRTEKQMVTKILLLHSGFALAVAKINKIVGFGKVFSAFSTVVAVVAVVAVFFHRFAP